MTTIRPGQTVAIHSPLDPHDLNPHLGQVIRLRRQPWGDGADVTRSYGDTSSGWSPTWVTLDALHPVDDATYCQWQAHRSATLTRLREQAQPATSTWQERHEARQIDRAHRLGAIHDALIERWRRNGILDADQPAQPATPPPDGLDEPTLFDAA